MSSLLSHPAPTIGQDIGQFKAGAGSFGQAIPYVFGCALVPEFRLWQQNHATPRDGGGGGGKGNSGASSTLYSGDYFSGFCVGAIPTTIGLYGKQIAIRRIYLDSQLYWDWSEQKTWQVPIPETLQQFQDRLNFANSLISASRATFYEGLTSGQASDPNIAAAIGGTVPGWQGLVCASWHNLEWPSGRPYTVKVEICQKCIFNGDGSIIRQSCPLSEIFSRLLIDSGIPESNIDISALTTQQVRGIVVAQDQKRQAIDNLMRFFDLDCCDSGGIITFFPIDRPSMITIPYSDLSTITEGSDGGSIEPIEIKDIKQTDIAHSVQITAQDYDNDYNSLVEVYTDVTNDSQAVIQYDMGDFTATSTELRQACQKQLFRTRAERYTYDLTLPPEYENLEGGDVITITDEDNTLTTIRTKTVDIGATDNIVKVNAVRHSVFTSAIQGSPTFGGVSFVDAGSTTWGLLNIPPVHDAEANNPGGYFYASGSSVGWLHATLYQSKDSGASYSQMASIASYATIGSCTTTLADGQSYTWDTTSTLTVSLPRGQLSSVTDAQIFNGANLCAVFDPATGRTELLQFATATLVSAGVYTISRLLRGRRATEPYMTGHVSSEKFVLLNDVSGTLSSGVTFVECGYGDLGRTDLGKMVPNGHALSDETAQSFTITGQNMVPFDPVNLTTDKTGLPDLIINWMRRDRKGGELMSGAEIPLSEVPERYHVQILNSSMVSIRSDYSTSGTYNYTGSMRAADFGSSGASIAGSYIKIAQVSPNIGDGRAALLLFTTDNSQ